VKVKRNTFNASQSSSCELSRQECRKRVESIMSASRKSLLENFDESTAIRINFSFTAANKKRP
jgi:hypothetical protein